MLDGQPPMYSILIGQMNDKLSKGKLTCYSTLGGRLKGKINCLSAWYSTLNGSLRMVFDLDF